MNRAFQEVKARLFFAAESGKYRYWYDRIKGVLKIQMARKAMNEFRASAVGLRLAQYVDIFEIGGGWFEVHGGDTSQFDKFGTHTDGLKMWVRAFNEHHLSGINANTHKHQVVYRQRMPSYLSAPVAPAISAPTPAQLGALVARFSRGA